MREIKYIGQTKGTDEIIKEEQVNEMTINTDSKTRSQVTQET